MVTRKHRKKQKRMVVIDIDDYVKEDDILRKIDGEVDTSFVNEKVEKKYSDSGRGAPPEDPERIFRQLVGMLILGIRSERQLEEATRTNLRLRWFAKYEIDEKVPDHSTISKARKRFGVDAFDAILSEIVHQCIEKGYLGGDLSCDRTDMKATETPLTSREQALILTREVAKVLKVSEEVEQVMQTDNVKGFDNTTKDIVANVISDLAKVPEKFKGKVVNELLKILEGYKEDVKRDKTTSAETEEKDEGKERHRKKGTELLEDWKIEDKERIKEAIESNNTSEIKDGLEKELKMIPQARAGTDAKFGHTTEEEDFFGYNASLMRDHKEGIITSCDLNHGNRRGNEQFPQIYEKHKERCGKPKSIRMDSEYDTKEVRDILEEDKVVDYISQRKPTGRKGIFRFDEFELDENEDMFCPAGKKMKKSKKPLIENGKEIWLYRGVGCDECKLKDKCTKSWERRVKINLDDYRRYLRVKEFNRSEEYKREIKRRMEIEALIGHGKTYHNLGKARYRDFDMIKIQLIMIAIVLDMERMAVIRRQMKRVMLRQ